MLRLAEQRTGQGGIYCGADGLYLGAAALIEPDEQRGYRIRSAAEIAALLAAAYEVPPDAARFHTRLGAIAADLRAGNVSLAQIRALRLRLDEIPKDRVGHLSRIDEFLKANFNPDEPRDRRGRWTDGEDGDDPEPGEGNSSGHIVPGNAGVGEPDPAPAWKKFPNADFRNRLAEAEGSARRKDFGYGEVHNSPDPRRVALGRYQMTPPALQAAGLTDRAGNWTGKYGIHSRAEFLADPEAQEQALTDYLNDLERQLRANGAYAHIGETIDGLKARFPVTRAGILAGGHREGARATADYLDRVEVNGLTSKGLRLKPEDPAIETRLRTFAGAHYE